MVEQGWASQRHALGPHSPPGFEEDPGGRQIPGEAAVLHSTRISYDIARWSEDRAEAHVRAVAATVFPEARGFDHSTMKLYLPGLDQNLPNGQTFRWVLVDCRKIDGA